jgi:pilus assembly protein CpaE
VYSLSVGLVIGTKELWNEVHQSLESHSARILIAQHEIGDWPRFLERIENAKPDLLVIDLGCLTEPFEQVIAAIRSVPDAPIIAAAHTQTDPETILNAMRAGANEFLYPPVDGTLQKAIARLTEERQRQSNGTRRKGKVLGFFSAKGGCGATTIACNLAVEIPRQTKQQLLLADLDFDAGIIGFLTKSPSEYSVLDAAKNIHRLDLAYWKKLVSNGIPGVEIIPVPKLSLVRDALSIDALRPIVTFFRSHYDWTVLDLGRSLTHTSLNAIGACDEAYLVTTLEVPALHQSKQIIQKLLDSGYPRESIRVVINRMQKTSELTLDEIEKVLGHTVYTAVPNDSDSLNESHAEGRLLNENSQIRRHLVNVARRIAGIPEEKGKRRFSLFG